MILTDGTTYDYIIVGGGSAGSVVATRLAEDKKNKILVLEAGYTPPINALVHTWILLKKSILAYLAYWQ